LFRYNNFFDYILLGFHSKNIIPTCNQIAKPNFKLILELCTYMSCFKEQDKEASVNKLKELTEVNGFIVEDTSHKGVWKYIKKDKSKDELDQRTNEQSNMPTEINQLTEDKV
jgi:hypothetical protein